MLLHLHGFIEALPDTESLASILVVFGNFFQYFPCWYVVFLRDIIKEIPPKLC